MSLKTKALAQTFGIFMGIFGGAIMVSFILDMIPAAYIPYIGMAILLTVLFNVIYAVVLSRMEYENTLKEMVDNKSKA